MTWYPWQSFVTKKEVIIPLGVSTLIIIATAVWMYVKLRVVVEPVFLHYSVELGVDAVGDRLRAGSLVALGVLIIGAHTLWCNYLLGVSRMQAQIVAYATVPLAIAIVGCAALVLRANGV